MKKTIKVLIILITTVVFAINCGKTYSRYVLTRQFEATFSSYPFYFEANIVNDVLNYNESGINIPINIFNYVDDYYNAFNTDYEITIGGNTKFQLSDVVRGTVNGHAKETKVENIKITSASGANISGDEKLNIIIKSTEPYSKEITIPITITVKKNGALYSFMQAQANGKTDVDTDFYDIDIQNGVYMHDETKSDPYPVYYYRGNVNNSLIYAGHCWQIVRTTESGGLKLVYDGKVRSGDTCTDDHNYLGSEMYNDKVGGLASPSQVGYKYSVTAGIEAIVPSRIEDMGQVPEDISDKMPTDGVLIGKTVTWNGNSYTINDAQIYINSTARLIYKDAIDDVKDDSEKRYYTCLNTSDTCNTVYYLYKRSGENVYAIELANDQSLADAIKGKTIDVGVVFGHDVTWDESSQQYTLTSPIVINDLDELEDDIRGGDSGNYSGKDPNAFHYTCLSTSTTCGTIYYIYYNDYGNYHDTYASGLFGIKLSDGKNIKEKLDEMLYGSTNTTYSHAAEYINAWFEGDKEHTDWRDGEVLLEHINELADDLWCNDRRIAGYHGWDINADNHSSDNKYLHFDAFKRLHGEGDLQPTRPDITCDDKNDSFTVSNPEGNRSLKYPVAMLTADEAALAGGIYGEATNNYLPVRNSKTQFFMTPYYVSDDHTRMFVMDENGTLDSAYASTGYALRPAIVLKDIFKISSGSGTHDDPYKLSSN